MKTRYRILAKAFDKKGRMVSSAYNDYTRTHPIQKHFAVLAGMPYCECLHAEILALLRAKGKQVHTLTIERYTKNGTPANAAPCPICQLAIKAFGVEVVKHT